VRREAPPPPWLQRGANAHHQHTWICHPATARSQRSAGRFSSNLRAGACRRGRRSRRRGGFSAITFDTTGHQAAHSAGVRRPKRPSASPLGPAVK
jgi:hypothetical protein